jgi:hypothetical protein
VPKVNTRLQQFFHRDRNQLDPPLLALVVLRSLAGAQQSVFLPLFDPRVPRQQTGLLEHGPELPVELDQGPGDPEPDGFGLPLGPASADPQEDVELVLRLREEERLADDDLVGVQAEIFAVRPRPLVDEQRDVALARTQEDPGDGRFPFTRSVVLDQTLGAS